MHYFKSKPNKKTKNKKLINIPCKNIIYFKLICYNSIHKKKERKEERKKEEGRRGKKNEERKEKKKMNGKKKFEVQNSI